MNSQPQAEYQVTRDGEVLGTFTAEQLSSGMKRGTLLVTDHYWCEGWPEPQPLADLFPSKPDSRSTKQRTELRHVGIALVMILGIAAFGFAVFVIVKSNQVVVETSEAPALVPRPAVAPDVGRLVPHDETAVAPVAAQAPDPELKAAQTPAEWPPPEVLTEELYQKACRLRDGEGVPKDAAESARIFIQLAEKGHAGAQSSLGWMCAHGDGIAKDMAKAVEWWSKAAEQGDATAQTNLGLAYATGDGIDKNVGKAFEWLTKAAEQGSDFAQCHLGVMYSNGEGAPKDAAKALEWSRKAAEQGCAPAQCNLAIMYFKGEGVPKDAIQAYYWWNLASGAGHAKAREFLAFIEEQMTPSQIAEAQRMAREFKPRKAIAETDNASTTMISDSRPAGHGTGFFISPDGYLITNHHVVEGISQVRINTGSGIKAARIIRLDKANDLALLKVEGTFPSLPIASSRAIALGNTVATVGFPNIQLMGFSPKLAKGDIASLAGIQDDPRYFQISVPVQPGNSGGALVDGAGNVVGVVTLKLSATTALAATGALPENVNYAVKSSFLLSFLESVPELAGKLPDPHSGERKFEDVVKDAQQASALVLVY